ncbi:hypothetical protein IAU60_005834 [Kwoniella sp. DSM 27419]
MAVQPSVPEEQQGLKFDCFFYGTLCVPACLMRVLGRKCEDLTFQDALLEDYTRHTVKGEPYPAIINREDTISLYGQADNNTGSKGLSTRGTLVRGLSYKDISLLDIYEGTEYSRKKLPVQTLTEPAPINELPSTLSDPTSRVSAENTPPETGRQGSYGKVEAWTFVWSDPLDRLEPEIWTFEEFIQSKKSAWNDLPTEWFTDVERQQVLQLEPAPTHKGELAAAVDDELSIDGETGRIVGEKAEGFPDFGHNMRQYWGFDKNYVNLNHGSYGSPPTPVIKQMRELSDQTEANPDFFMRRAWLPLLTKVREEVSELIGARTEEVVIVPNTTHGVNTVLANMDWAEGDILAIYSTTYGAVAQMAKYIADRHYQIKVEIIDVTFPTTHQSIVQQTEEFLEKYNKPAIPNYTGQPKATGHSPHERVRAVVVDAIASNPGVIYPWEETVKLCKKYGVLSIVDAAHAIGQVEVDVKRADCDFWVSNCHKWLMSHRGGAVLYVPIRNQMLVRSSFPTSAGYESTRYPTEGADRPWSFIDQFSWTGTQDWTPFFSITFALEFRRKIGGEKRIRDYCHTLAVEGGRRLKKKWGTEVMEVPNGELTAAMVNVALPHIPPPRDLKEQYKQLTYFMDKCFEGNTFVAAYTHGGKWWARFSGQVWLQLSDFDYAADVIEQICRDIKAGKHLEGDIDETEVEEEAKDLPTADQ